MNIAIFSPNKNPYSETFIQAHKHYLKGPVFYFYGSGQHIVLENKPPLLSKWAYRFCKLWAKLLNKPKHYVRDYMLQKAFKTYKITAVLVEYGTHAHHLLSFLNGLSLPVVVHFHGYDASKKDLVEQCGHYTGVFKQAHKVVAVSKVMENKLLQMGCPKEKLVYNVYGPRPEFLEVFPKYIKQQFVAVGRFTDKKAPYYTILAFHAIAQQFPQAKLLMAGDGVLKSTCQNLVRHLGLQEQVVFLGVIDHQRYRELLAESLAFVQHSITAANGDMEGTPVAILEASAAGLPVVATRHAGIPDVVLHEKTGLLCNEHDVEGMANNMARLLNNSTEAQQMGQAGKQRILKHFNMQRHIEVLEKALQR